MADPPNRPKPGPRPQTTNPSPEELSDQQIDRRKVLFGLTFGAAAAGGVSILDSGGGSLLDGLQRLGDAASVDVAGATQLPDDGESPITTNPVAGVFDPPVLDSSFALQAGQPAAFALVGGRIIDPESGFDRVGNIGLLDGKVVAISEDAIPADETIDVSGRVISPGFIDILSYQPNGYGEWFKIADGVTSNIGMHGLQFEPVSFYDDWTNEGVPINFGGAAHNTFVRTRLEVNPFDTAADGKVVDIVGEIESQIRAGYLGVSVHPEYAPGVSQLELMELGRTVERLQVPMCVHARFSDNISPGLQSEATGELVQVARETGAHVHIEHLNSTGGTGRMAEALGEIEDALAEGLSMSACMYPYEFWATTLKSNRFQDWQEKFGLSYDQLQVAGQPERLTAETFAQAYDENLLTAAFAIPPGDIDLGLQASFMIIGSDAILERPHNNHPRSTGCFARTLGVYTRDRNIIDLPQALAMMTIRPAKLLERGSPAMRTKGRMQIGADADVTVFNPDTIIDRSTIENPAQESVGVDYVFVNGTAIRRAGINQLDIGRPGSAIRSSII